MVKVMTLSQPQLALDDATLETDRQQLTTWSQEFDCLLQRLQPRFHRPELRARVKAYVQGLLSSVSRKNSWQLAEQVGDATPYGLQHLLGRAQWDADAVRDDLQDYVHESMGDPNAVLIIDETSFLKKGVHSAGVQAQYSGTVGRVANCQVGVFLCYASDQGYSLIDRALYLPQSWLNDRERCAGAGIPKEIAFATKPVLAKQMLERALLSGIPARWVTGDEVYGRDVALRHWLESRHQAYVLTISTTSVVGRDAIAATVQEFAASWPAEEWQRLSCGQGSQGERYFDWMCMPINSPDVNPWPYWILVRRSIEPPDHWDYFWVYAPPETSLQTMVQVAGRRWRIETSFETAKGEVGLDEYEVRTWTGWYRHITLAMLALAYLSVTRMRSPTAGPKKGDAPTPQAPT